ncbi:2-hydroxyacid dehydrogenase [Nocardioides luteus]|uniref:Dehydrogenase n=2 Tax=Nocardioides luteus TaxID=1844 RepID=A0ABQ5SQC2_9ACTN|nr:2-hydroxyacid dehydrogenase [Nocardioides luteus]GGR44341.1 dehydrogenase [Nocardioides luteus]GLJ66129.1 dehydrogenase [Nocardioides luteus]
MRVLVPWAQLEEQMGGWPDGLQVEVYDGTGAPPEDVSDVELYVLPYGRSVGRDLLPRMPALRAVQSLSAGVEKVLPLIGPNVTLCNGRGLHDASAAEHGLGLILAAQRELPRWVRDQDAGRWAPEHTRSLADSRVVLVGYGSIGAALEQRLLACEAEVVRVASKADPGRAVHGVDELPSLLPTADIVVLTLPETPGTIGLVGAETLALLPDDALVVNIGRGRTLDTEALLAELTTGRLRAALDVVDPEPLPSDHPLWTSGAIVTPHVGGGAATFYPRAERLVAEQLRRFADGRPLLNVVSGPELPQEAAPSS